MIYYNIRNNMLLYHITLNGTNILHPGTIRYCRAADHESGSICRL
jgi:hypothetical protein